jgi:hypothetical protein
MHDGFSDSGIFIPGHRFPEPMSCQEICHVVSLESSRVGSVVGQKFAHTSARGWRSSRLHQTSGPLGSKSTRHWFLLFSRFKQPQFHAIMYLLGSPYLLGHYDTTRPKTPQGLITFNLWYILQHSDVGAPTVVTEQRF